MIAAEIMPQNWRLKLDKTLEKTLPSYGPNGKMRPRKKNVFENSQAIMKGAHIGIWVI